MHQLMRTPHLALVLNCAFCVFLQADQVMAAGQIRPKDPQLAKSLWQEIEKLSRMTVAAAPRADRRREVTLGALAHGLVYWKKIPSSDGRPDYAGMKDDHWRTILDVTRCAIKEFDLVLNLVRVENPESLSLGTTASTENDRIRAVGRIVIPSVDYCHGKMFGG
jgi:hypothetical protein